MYWIRHFTGTLAAAMAVISGYLMSPKGWRGEKVFPSGCWGDAAALGKWEQVCPVTPGSGPEGGPGLPGHEAPLKQYNPDWSNWAEK